METSSYRRITRLERAVANLMDYLSHAGEPIGPESAKERYVKLRKKLEPLLADVDELDPVH